MKYTFKFQDTVLCEEELPNDVLVLNGFDNIRNFVNTVFDLSYLPVHIYYSKIRRLVSVCETCTGSPPPTDELLLWESDESVVKRLVQRLQE